MVKLERRTVMIQQPKNPFEEAGLKIVDDNSDRSWDYISIIYEGWHERHPGRDYSKRFAYPDALKFSGRIVPRLKRFIDITLQDCKDAGLGRVPEAMTILAKDRSVDELYIH